MVRVGLAKCLFTVLCKCSFLGGVALVLQSDLHLADGSVRTGKAIDIQPSVAAPP